MVAARRWSESVNRVTVGRVAPSRSDGSAVADCLSTATLLGGFTMTRWLKRIALALACLTMILVGTGAGYEAVMRSRSAHDYPAPGRLIDIGGRRLQLDCRGTGSPTVVFESGLDYLGSL